MQSVADLFEDRSDDVKIVIVLARSVQSEGSTNFACTLVEEETAATFQKDFVSTRNNGELAARYHLVGRTECWIKEIY